MLRVPARLAPSAIHGLGVFAVEAIAAGTEIWRFTPGLDRDLTPGEVAAFPADIRVWLDHYAYLDRWLGRWILCVDEARFMNHSDRPNTRQEREADPYGVDSAARDIAAGEEITCDYRTFEAPVDGGVEGSAAAARLTNGHPGAVPEAQSGRHVSRTSGGPS